MTVQFALPPEYVAATKAQIAAINPTNQSPSDSDVQAYIYATLVNTLGSTFPGVVIAQNATAAAAIKTQQAAMSSNLAAALAVTVSGS